MKQLNKELCVKMYAEYLTYGMANIVRRYELSPELLYVLKQIMLEDRFGSLTDQQIENACKRGAITLYGFKNETVILEICKKRIEIKNPRLVFIIYSSEQKIGEYFPPDYFIFKKSTNKVKRHLVIENIF